jgi:hypothetical protein
MAAMPVANTTAEEPAQWMGEEQLSLLRPRIAYYGKKIKQNNTELK